jgi:hypothetical protein
MLKSRTSRLAAVASGVVVSAGALLAVSAPAQATPGTCSYSVGSWTVSLRCTTGTGQYRVWGDCTDEIRGSTVRYYGTWVSIGSVSSVICPNEGGSQWLLTGHGKQTR